MDVSVVLTIVQTLLQLLDSPIWTELKSLRGYRSQLEKLKITMSTIKAVLLDAEQQQRQQLQLTNTQLDKLDRLKEAVYQADDLFNEVATLAQHKKLMFGNNVSQVVRDFFSRFNQLRSAFTLPREIRKIREILDDIARDHHDFGLTQSVGLQGKNKSRETHSYVCEEDVIIGRDDDMQIIIGSLTHTTFEENVCCVSIVGIGGLGKTTLAQLVYNHERIDREFSLKIWVCVSDDFNVKAILAEILAAATGKFDHDGLNMDQLQMKLRQALDGKKYLLVLDDVWNEDVNEWLKLRNLLIRGGKGSRIVVTTRSREVAKIVGSQKVHELKGLSEKDSWNLFERMTLEPGQHQMEAHLVDVGKVIVQKCANVPLAIRVIGSVLRGQGEGQWRYIRNSNLANVQKDGIHAVLKMSYYYLPVHLKSCFSYCAVFPKDCEIIKEDLICLWMAQGFIVPLDGESFEEAGEEYFRSLLQRCFFQDVKRAESCEIVSCKMHDLIHDVAKEVAGTEIFSLSCFNEKTRHLYLDSTLETKNVGHCLTKMKRLRTILQPLSSYTIPLNKFLLKQRYLRVLDLRNTVSEKLPSTIGELLHLKYLDLSYNRKLFILPVSITQLYNLETLKLRDCRSLKELPRELSKLLNLRHLDIHGCWELTHMPQEMNIMTSLHKLTRFVFGGDEFQDLKYLNNLGGSMEIKVQNGWTYDAAEVKEGRYLINKPHLRNINIYWYLEPYAYQYLIDRSSADEGNNSEALLQGLQPHSNLRMLELCHYPGVRFPSWGGSATNLRSCLPNLVKIELIVCTRLENLPLMSQLRHLKVLILKYLFEVEYVESSNFRGEGGSTASKRSRQVRANDEFVFFPSLEKLELINLAKLKGWWKSSSSLDSDSESEAGDGETKTGDGDHDRSNNELQQEQFSVAGVHSYSFPRLSYLAINGCPELTTFPLCPKLETLKLHYFNEALGLNMSVSSGESSSANGFYSDKFSPLASMFRQKQEEADVGGRLREVEIDNVAYLNSMPICMGSFHHLSKLRIMLDWKLESMTTVEVRQVFQSGRLSSLRTLVFDTCSTLKKLTGQGVWEHLTALENLCLSNLRELELNDADEEEEVKQGSRITSHYRDGEGKREIKEDNYGILADTPWRCLAPTLRNLELRYLQKLVKLPKGMHHLTALHSLQISRCENLEAVPQWIACLSSLHSLQIEDCERLKSLPEEMHHLTSLQRLELWYNSRELHKRCQKLTGAYWPKIQHIPNISMLPS